MKKLFVMILVFLFLPSLALAQQFTVDPSHSQIGFSVRHLVVASVKGKFNKFQGEVDFTVKTKELKQVSATIQTTSIDTNHAKRDRHLRSPDFFSSKQFPKITFKSTQITNIGNEYKLVGLLTIKNVTRTIQLKGTLLGMVKDDQGKTILGFHAEGEIDRYDYGLTYNKTMEMGGLAVGKKVMLILDIQLNI